MSLFSLLCWCILNGSSEHGPVNEDIVALSLPLFMVSVPGALVM